MAEAALAELDELAFYRQHSPLTDPGDHRELLAGLPANVAALGEIVRGVLVHRDETVRLFGFELPTQRRDEANTRYVAAILDRLGDLVARPATQRFAGTCRDFSILLCAMLREAGVPARLRCGFAGYFAPGCFDDHWVVEYWADEHGWRLADAQLAGFAREAYGADVNPSDVPRDRFLVAGRAWLDCRTGRRDPGTFGVISAGFTGMTEVQGNVVRDLAALNLTETLPWDEWGIIARPYGELAGDELALLDRAAQIGAHGGPLAAALDLYRCDRRLHTPPALHRGGAAHSPPEP
jgi:transglutaminase-like putative cysteine protease